MAFFWSCFGWGLQSPFRYRKDGGLLHHLSTLTLYQQGIPCDYKAVYFCCTGLRVTSTGRYPASYPVKPGLSSSATKRLMQPRLSVLLNIYILYRFLYNSSTTILYKKLNYRRFALLALALALLSFASFDIKPRNTQSIIAINEARNNELEYSLL